MPGIANEPSDEDAALIAQLLAEDNPYADAPDSGSGSDYEKPKRRRKGRQGANRICKSKRDFAHRPTSMDRLILHA